VVDEVGYFWPALWLLGTNISSINWPNCGEIDVVENTGTNSFIAQSSIHYGGDGTATYKFFDGNAVTNFHTYTMDWTTNAMLFFVDGHLFESQTGTWGNPSGASPFPFNRPFFLLMNLAVGGNYVGNPSQANINANTVFPAEFLVDYVRVYNTTEPFRIAITQTSSNAIRITKPKGILTVSTDAPQGFESIPKERTFNLVPGLEAAPLILALTPGIAATIRITASPVNIGSGAAL